MVLVIGLVLLTVLKILGIVIASVLGLLLVLLMVVLFVPIRYRIIGEKKEQISLIAKVTWLLHAISFRVEYAGGPVVTQLRVFGIPFPIGKKSQKKEKRQKKKKEKEQEAEWEDFELQALEMPVQEPDAKSDQPVERETLLEDGEKQTSMKDSSSKEDAADRSGKGHRFFKKRKKEKKTPKEEGETKEKKSIVSKLKDIKELIEKEETKRTLSFLKKEIVALLLYLLPRKGRLYLHFGFSDPAMTGQVYGVLCLFPLVLRKVELEPEFERVVMEAEADMKGRLRIAYFVRLLFRAWRNKDLKATYHMFRG